MIQLTANKEPGPEDADRDEYVRAYNVRKGVWENRFWYDFPAHPGWTDQQRKDIRENWPKWASNQSAHDGVPLVVIVTAPGCPVRVFKTMTFADKEQATLEALQSIGLPFHESRGDLLHLEVVSRALWGYLPATWIRP